MLISGASAIRPQSTIIKRYFLEKREREECEMSASSTPFPMSILWQCLIFVIIIVVATNSGSERVPEMLCRLGERCVA
jgi:hypothetical protein